MRKLFFFLIAVAILIWIFVSRSSVDQGSWLCQGGEWVRQGNPTEAKPLEPCEAEKTGKDNNQPITNFMECLEAGNAVMESYPRQCRAGGEVFVEHVGNELDKLNLIRLNYPRPNQGISSPLVVKGEARGMWYFEADFPVFLVNWDGLIIAQGIAQAQGDWMTEEFVPFEVTLEFDASEEVYNRGALILKKDNPSGLPEHDDALEIPIFFKTD